MKTIMEITIMINEIRYEDLDFSKFTIDETNINIRIDKFLSSLLTNFSRSYIQDLNKENYVFVKNENCKPSYKLELNDEVIVYFKPIEDLK